MKTLAALPIALATAACGFVYADQVPIDCKMQSFHSVMTAMERDQGKGREDTKVSRNSSRKLTDAEIKTILDRVYISMKNDTPRQIGSVVYAECQKAR